MFEELLKFYGILNLMIHAILFVGWQFGLVGFTIKDNDDET